MSIDDLKRYGQKAQATVRALTEERDQLVEVLKLMLTPEQYQQVLADSNRRDREAEATLERLSLSAKQLVSEPESEM